MAKRKTKQDIDIAVDEPVPAPAAEPVTAGQPEPPVEKAVPELTVRIFPVRNPKSKLRATANVTLRGPLPSRASASSIPRMGCL